MKTKEPPAKPAVPAGVSGPKRKKPRNSRKVETVEIARVPDGLQEEIPLTFEKPAPPLAAGKELTTGIDAIRPPDAALAYVRPKSLQEMVTAIQRTRGGIRLIQVREIRGGDADGYWYELVTGMLEYQAHRVLKSSAVRVRVRECSDVEANQSRLMERIRDAGPDTWPKVIGVAGLRESLGRERGCDPADVPQVELVAKTPLDEGTVSLCWSAYTALTGAGVDLNDPLLHDVSRTHFRLIGKASDPERVLKLVAHATRPKPAPGKARAEEAEARFGSLVSMTSDEHGISATLASGVAPEDAEWFLRYAMGRIRRAYFESAKGPVEVEAELDNA
jgi:hypothetical protein